MFESCWKRLAAWRHRSSPYFDERLSYDPAKNLFFLNFEGLTVRGWEAIERTGQRSPAKSNCGFAQVPKVSNRRWPAGPNHSSSRVALSNPEPTRSSNM
jgi:hypothetical protein